MSLSDSEEGEIDEVKRKEEVYCRGKYKESSENCDPMQPSYQLSIPAPYSQLYDDCYYRFVKFRQDGLYFNEYMKNVYILGYHKLLKKKPEPLNVIKYPPKPLVLFDEDIISGKVLYYGEDEIWENEESYSGLYDIVAKAVPVYERVPVGWNLVEPKLNLDKTIIDLKNEMEAMKNAENIEPPQQLCCESDGQYCKRLVQLLLQNLKTSERHVVREMNGNQFVTSLTDFVKFEHTRPPFAPAKTLRVFKEDIDGSSRIIYGRERKLLVCRDFARPFENFEKCELRLVTVNLPCIVPVKPLFVTRDDPNVTIASTIECVLPPYKYPPHELKKGLETPKVFCQWQMNEFKQPPSLTMEHWRGHNYNKATRVIKTRDELTGQKKEEIVCACMRFC